jgi:hypothetical protein
VGAEDLGRIEPELLIKLIMKISKIKCENAREDNLTHHHATTGVLF